MSHDLAKLIIDTAYHLPPADGDVKAWRRYVKYVNKEHERQQFIWIEQHMGEIMRYAPEERIQSVFKAVDIYKSHEIYFCEFDCKEAHFEIDMTDSIHHDFYFKIVQAIFPNASLKSKAHGMFEFYFSGTTKKRLTWEELAAT